MLDFRFLIVVAARRSQLCCAAYEEKPRLTWRTLPLETEVAWINTDKILIPQVLWRATGRASDRAAGRVANLRGNSEDLSLQLHRTETVVMVCFMIYLFGASPNLQRLIMSEF